MVALRAIELTSSDEEAERSKSRAVQPAAKYIRARLYEFTHPRSTKVDLPRRYAIDRRWGGGSLALQSPPRCKAGHMAFACSRRVDSSQARMVCVLYLGVVPSVLYFSRGSHFGRLVYAAQVGPHWP